MISRFLIGGWLFRLGLALSLAGHLGALAYFGLREPEAPGAAAFPTAAISINLETTDILDAREESPAKAAAPQAMQVESASPEDAEDEREAAQPKAEERPEPEMDAVEATSEPKDNEQTPPQNAATEAEPEAAPVKPDNAAEALAEKKAAEEALRKEQEARQRREAEQRRRDAQERERKKSREAAKKRRIEEARQAEEARRKRARARAQASASGTKKAQASAGRVSASQGAIRNYAAKVRARIARNKPPSGGRRGQVVLSFSLSSSGGLTSARIATSSGNSALDRSALAAIRRAAPFPRPPQGATASQLRFTIPFRFR